MFSKIVYTEVQISLRLESSLIDFIENIDFRKFLCQKHEFSNKLFLILFTHEKELVIKSAINSDKFF